MANEDFAFSFNRPYKSKCALPDCKRVGYRITRITIDGNQLDFCSPQHAAVGKQRWMEKKKMGITPQTPKPTENPIEAETGGLSEEGSEEI